MSEHAVEVSEGLLGWHVKGQIWHLRQVMVVGDEVRLMWKSSCADCGHEMECSTYAKGPTKDNGRSCGRTGERR